MELRECIMCEKIIDLNIVENHVYDHGGEVWCSKCAEKELRIERGE